MFGYQFPSSPYTVDLKEARGEYAPIPDSNNQPLAAERTPWRMKLARQLQVWANRLEPNLQVAAQSLKESPAQGEVAKGTSM